MLIEINTTGTLPIYEQLRNQIVLGIASKRLMPGEALPSVRRLAADLGINFHTVNKAYTMLQDEGYIVVDRRKGALVAHDITGSEMFHAGLMQKLTLASAEAICRGMDEKEFAELCVGRYRMAQGDVSVSKSQNRARKA